jgi:hypothetical protein
MNSVHQVVWWKTQQGSKAIVTDKVRFTLCHPMHFPNIVLNKQGSIELGYHLKIPVMLELHDSCPLQAVKTLSREGLWQLLASYQLIHWQQVTMGHGENHNIIAVPVLLSVKPVVKSYPLKCPTRIHTSIPSWPSSHMLDASNGI